MTPTAGVLVGVHFADAAFIITASHNPSEWNGIKLVVYDGLIRESDLELMSGEEVLGSTDQPGASAPSAAVAQELIARFHDGICKWSSQDEVGGLTNEMDATRLHIEMIRDAFPLGSYREKLSRSFRIVLDSVNCSGSDPAIELCKVLGSTPIQLFGDGSGIFPHTPEPTRENLSGEGGLCDAVPGLKAGIGFAQDPDADRLAIVDETGRYIGEEYTLVLCAMALMEARGDDGLEARPTGEQGKPVFVVNLSTSRMIDDIAAHYGAEVVRTAVGEANVVEGMKRLTAAGWDVVMGGEGNGGVIWAQVTYVRDSLSAMALTLALMAQTGKTVSELVAMVDAMGPGGKGYCILKRKSELTSKADAVPVVEHLAKVYRAEDGAVVDTQDGVRIDWPQRGVWAHVRASNTEAIMRVIVEAPTEAEAASVAASVEGRIGEVRG
jgi:phosphomannomutase